MSEFAIAFGDVIDNEPPKEKVERGLVEGGGSGGGSDDGELVEGSGII